jgi:hypothetical protein
VIWVVAADVNGCRIYWAGFNAIGELKTTAYWSEAQKFQAPREAYRACETHDQLARSDEWRVVKIGAGSERTS